jgi:hypothetical protein
MPHLDTGVSSSLHPCNHCSTTATTQSKSHLTTPAWPATLTGATIQPNKEGPLHMSPERMSTMKVRLFASVASTHVLQQAIAAALTHCLKPVLHLMHCPFPWLCVQLVGPMQAAHVSLRTHSSCSALLSCRQMRSQGLAQHRLHTTGYTLQPLAVFPLHPCCSNALSRTCSTPQTLHNPSLNCTRGKLIADLLILYNVGSTGAAHSGLHHSRPHWIKCDQAATTQHHMSTTHLRTHPQLHRGHTPGPWSAICFNPVHGKHAGVSTLLAALGGCCTTSSVCGTCSFWDCIWVAVRRMFKLCICIRGGHCIALYQVLQRLTKLFLVCSK